MPRSLRHTVAATALFLAGIASAVAAEPDDATRQTILTLRDQAWRSWFANDRERFLQVVPDELVAIGWDGGAWQDREATLKSMADFAAGGRRLVSLDFPHDVFQQYGDTVILYTRFAIGIADPAGTVTRTEGRGTEIFVRRDGRWIHTGWHLDTIAD
jgi:hypothetical protein